MPRSLLLQTGRIQEIDEVYSDDSGLFPLPFTVDFNTLFQVFLQEKKSPKGTITSLKTVEAYEGPIWGTREATFNIQLRWYLSDGIGQLKRTGLHLLTILKANSIAVKADTIEWSNALFLSFALNVLTDSGDAPILGLPNNMNIWDFKRQWVQGYADVIREAS